MDQRLHRVPNASGGLQMVITPELGFGQTRTIVGDGSESYKLILKGISKE